MEITVFSFISVLISIFFLECNEVDSYITDREKKILLLANISISLVLYVLKVDIAYIFTLQILLGSAYIDYRYREIPDSATLISLLIVLIFTFLNLESINMIDIALGLSIYAIFLISCLLGYIGGGDIKIFLPLVILMGGVNFALFIMLTGIMVLSKELINFMHTKEIDMKKEIALAPFFYLATAGVSLLI